MEVYMTDVMNGTGSMTVRINGSIMTGGMNGSIYMTSGMNGSIMTSGINGGMYDWWNVWN